MKINQSTLGNLGFVLNGARTLDESTIQGLQ